MKWLIFGGKGWIGTQVISILKNLEQDTVCSKCRADSEKDVEEEILEEKPDRIICLIGRTHGQGFNTIDYLEQKGKAVENIRDNLYGPVVLANLAKKHSIHLTYMGTGCIFKYDEEHLVPKDGLNSEETKKLFKGFSEEDEPNFFGSSYSVVKGYTDRLMHQYEDHVLNIRIRMPITNHSSGRNFITKITNYEKICSMQNSMTVLPELLPIMIDMGMKNVTGTINLTNPGTISHNEILDMYKEIVDSDFIYKNFSYEEQLKILAADRSNNYLDTTKLESMYPKVKDIKDSVRDIMFEIKERLV